MPATYVPDADYYRAVSLITNTFRLIAENRIGALRNFIRKTGTTLDKAFAMLGADPDQRATVVKALGELEPDPWTGEIEECQVKLVLGEIGDVWPENIRTTDDIPDAA